MVNLGSNYACRVVVPVLVDLASAFLSARPCSDVSGRDEGGGGDLRPDLGMIFPVAVTRRSCSPRKERETIDDNEISATSHLRDRTESVSP